MTFHLPSSPWPAGGRFVWSTGPFTSVRSCTNPPRSSHHSGRTIDHPSCPAQSPFPFFGIPNFHNARIFALHPALTLSTPFHHPAEFAGVRFQPFSLSRTGLPSGITPMGLVASPAARPTLRHAASILRPVVPLPSSTESARYDRHGPRRSPSASLPLPIILPDFASSIARHGTPLVSSTPAIFHRPAHWGAGRILLLSTSERAPSRYRHRFVEQLGFHHNRRSSPTRARHIIPTWIFSSARQPSFGTVRPLSGSRPLRSRTDGRSFRSAQCAVPIQAPGLISVSVAITRRRTGRSLRPLPA